ncbi:MAG: hypothetical protein AAB846_00875 [Patescibacteria group bacterium]
MSYGIPRYKVNERGGSKEQISQTKNKKPLKPRNYMGLLFFALRLEPIAKNFIRYYSKIL